MAASRHVRRRRRRALGRAAAGPAAAPAASAALDVPLALPGPATAPAAAVSGSVDFHGVPALAPESLRGVLEARIRESEGDQLGSAPLGRESPRGPPRGSLRGELRTRGRVQQQVTQARPHVPHVRRHAARPERGAARHQRGERVVQSLGFLIRSEALQHVRHGPRREIARRAHGSPQRRRELFPGDTHGVPGRRSERHREVCGDDVVEFLRRRGESRSPLCDAVVRVGDCFLVPVAAEGAGQRGPQLAQQQDVPRVLLPVARRHDALDLFRGVRGSERRSVGERGRVRDEREEELVRSLPVRLHQARHVHGVEEPVRHLRGVIVRDGRRGSVGRAVDRRGGAEQGGASRQRRAEHREILELAREVLREERSRAARERPGAASDGFIVPCISRDALGEQQHAPRAAGFVSRHQARLHPPQQIEERERAGDQELDDATRSLVAVLIGHGARTIDRDVSFHIRRPSRLILLHAGRHVRTLCSLVLGVTGSGISDLQLLCCPDLFGQIDVTLLLTRTSPPCLPRSCDSRPCAYPSPRFVAGRLHPSSRLIASRHSGILALPSRRG